MTELGIPHADRVESAWSALLTVDGLFPLQVVVRESAPFVRPAGCISVVRLGQSVTVIVPTADLADEITVRLRGLSPEAMTAPDVLATGYVAGVEVRGPAFLYYPGARFPLAADIELEVVALADIESLLAAAGAEEVDESGLRHTTSAVSIVRDEKGGPVAAAAYTQWPERIAHMSVLTRADHRGRGHGTTVATDAANRAHRDGQLVQWRARPEASRALARRIGLEEMGAQAVLRLPVPEPVRIAAAILRRGDTLLLCHRHPEREWFPNVWDLPGGHVEGGETPSDALARELREELGVDLRAPLDPPFEHLADADTGLELTIWLIDYDGPIANLAPDEHDELRWFTVDEIGRLELPHPSYVELLGRAAHA